WRSQPPKRQRAGPPPVPRPNPPPPARRAPLPLEVSPPAGAPTSNPSPPPRAAAAGRRRKRPPCLALRCPRACASSPAAACRWVRHRRPAAPSERPRTGRARWRNGSAPWSRSIDLDQGAAQRNERRLDLDRDRRHGDLAGAALELDQDAGLELIHQRDVGVTAAGAE